MKKQKGFTLIELLVVIAVIGILAAVVLASLNGARDKSKDKAIISDLLNARTEIQSYFSTNGYVIPGGATISNYCPITKNSASAFAMPQTVDILRHADTTSGNTTASITNVWCAGSGIQWAVIAKLKTTGAGGATKYRCIDSTGVSKEATYSGGIGGFVNATTAALNDANDFTCN